MLKRLLLIMILAAPIAVFAQEKIAYINSQEIISKMPETKDMQAKLQAKQQTIETSRAAIEAEFNNKVAEFQKDTTEPTESVVKDRQKQLEDLKTRHDTFVQSSQTELEKEYNDLLAPIQQKFMKAIKEVGDAQNYLFIIDAASTLYSNPNAVNANKLVEAKLGITQ